MKKILFVLALLLGICGTSSAQALLSGFCTQTNPDNTNSSAVLTNLGSLSASIPCWSGPRPTDTGVPMASAGTLKHLFVSGLYNDGGSSPASWDVKVQVYVNGVATSLTCTMSLSGGTSSNSIASCSDVSHSVSVSLGDLISVKMSSDSLACTLASCPALGMYASVKLIP